jgi:hypothetical protein
MIFISMKDLIKKLLREELENDNYASWKGVEKYKIRKNKFINSIQSIKDLTNDKIPNIIEYLGYEGFNDEEDVIEYLTEKLEEYRNFSNPVTLYRIVAVENKKLINTGDLGEHFTPYKWLLDDGNFQMSIGSENWDDNWLHYGIEVLVPLNEINVIQTLLQNLSFPNEHEVNLKNDGKNIKIVQTFKI